ncbi:MULTISPECIES: hypothetical protein [unclassified Microbacterium]|uniref:hypothetical protein n=1 Tax=unclassified Microbacterium TaxID=2609290 RepID=UPI0011159CC4|nr:MULTISPECIES: hypothetical protein [unclassified Microbacterium]MXS73685.1 hypothetical protein [Microbacterium sp. TL13]
MDVRLSAIIARNLLVGSPAPVIEELRAVAGADLELLAQVAVSCARWYRTADSSVMCDALAEFENAASCAGRESRVTFEGDNADYEGVAG